MRRMKLIFSYDGSGFCGLQKQPHKRSVQGEIEACLSRIDKQTVRLISSGRTDAKVHAIAQVAHFDIEHPRIQAEQIAYLLQTQLPHDIVSQRVTEVPDTFHARFMTKQKEYWYKFRSKAEQPYSPFVSRYMAYVNDAIDVDSLNSILTLFVGRHDFSSFTIAKADVDCVREIYACYCEYDDAEACYIIKISGNGFLQYMVRMIVGYTFEVYRGKKGAEQITQLLQQPDKHAVHAKAEPQGLYLYRVSYPEVAACAQDDTLK